MTNGAYLDKKAIQHRVRAAALWAAIAAGLMLWYYYPRSDWILPEDNPQHAGSVLLLFTLEYGGWAMVLSTLLLLSGAVQSLLFDAVAAALSGSLLIVSGLMMLPGGGTQPLLSVICGALFVHSGWSAWREFRLLGPMTHGSGADTRYEILGPGLGSSPERTDEGPSLPDRLRSRAATTQTRPAAPEVPAEPTYQQPNRSTKPEAPEQPAPEGFLARFAKGNPRSTGE